MVSKTPIEILFISIALGQRCCGRVVEGFYRRRKNRRNRQRIKQKISLQAL